MIILYKNYGASDFTMLDESYSSEQISQIKYKAGRLLKHRSYHQSAEYLEKIPFTIYDAYNNFGDEFSILYAMIPLEIYEGLRIQKDDPEDKQDFSKIAEVLNEIGTYIRFIAVELMIEAPQSTANSLRSLRNSEIHKLVYGFIGVDGGYLGDFSYRTHHEFYIILDLDINPFDYEGTTRERFIKILSESNEEVQARILEGILNRYPVGSSELRSQERYDEISSWIDRLKGASPVKLPSLQVTIEVVDRALSDAEQLLHASGPISAVDRVHTALHGYISYLCKRSGFQAEKDQSLTKLFKLLRENHPVLKNIRHHQNEIIRVLNAISTIIDSLNTLRNRASVAHPNEILLDEPEAMLLINSARTILHYIDKRLHFNEE